MTRYYCPRGCQECDDPFDTECGACGAQMSADSTRYDEILLALEESQIAAVAREMAQAAQRGYDLYVCLTDCLAYYLRHPSAATPSLPPCYERARALLHAIRRQC